jgi:imidazolonepropionase-like amidohydrolase
MSSLVIEGARIFDGTSDDCPEGMSILIEDGTIREISAKPISATARHRINVRGQTVMPGLIDLHIHANASHLDLQKADRAGDPYRTAHAARMLRHALDCGFTTVRDVGGGDYSLARAIEDKLIRAPRFFYSGKHLSMTGGHGDDRPGYESHHSQGYCSCGPFNAGGVVVDGVVECIKAAREELRRGAHCIKIMGSGGIASPTDPIWMNQYREDEIRAIVGETMERRTYTAAHCHPAAAIRRCVTFGVRCIEHGTLIDEDTARFVAGQGAYIVPTIVTLYALVEQGERLNLPSEQLTKANHVVEQAMTGLEIMRRTGVKVGFGTDLLGDTYAQQCREFTLRSSVFTPIEILRQATSMSAEILMQAGKLGCIAEGAHADLIVVDGDPLKDISLLSEDGQRLSLILRAGEIIKNELS